MGGYKAGSSSEVLHMTTSTNQTLLVQNDKT